VSLEGDLDRSMHAVERNLGGVRSDQAALEHSTIELRGDTRALLERLQALEPHVGPLIERLRA
jgi:hypothetical protein